MHAIWTRLASLIPRPFSRTSASPEPEPNLTTGVTLGSPSAQTPSGSAPSTTPLPTILAVNPTEVSVAPSPDPRWVRLLNWKTSAGLLLIVLIMAAWIASQEDLAWFGDPPPPVTTSGLFNDPMILHRQADDARLDGKLDQAIELATKAIEVGKHTLGEQHETIAILLDELAAIQYTKGQYPEALKSTEEATKIREQTLGPTHESLAFSLQNQAMINRLLNRTTEADQLDTRAATILNQRSPIPPSKGAVPLTNPPPSS